MKILMHLKSLKIGTNLSGFMVFIYSRLIYILFFVSVLFIFMLFVQIYNFDDNNLQTRIYEENDDLKMKGVSGRIRLKPDFESEMILPDSVARESLKISTELNRNSSNLATFLSSSYDWQLVSGTPFKFFVYSAFYDKRKSSQPYIRIIAATLTKFPQKAKIKCKLYYFHTFTPIIVPAKVKIIRENWNLKYSASFVICPFGNNPVPDAVSIILNDIDLSANHTFGNILTVENHPNLIKNITKKLDFAVCVKPIHYSFNFYNNVIEFIELNQILGVNHFVFYNHSIGPETECLLNHYKKEGLVTILPWNLDIISQQEIRTEGLFAALNDCLYRTMFKFSYALMIDFDEYIIPHTEPNLLNMIKYMRTLKSNEVRGGGFSFQNAFFYMEWPDDPSRNGTFREQVTLSKTRRRSKLNIHKQRSKVIVLPENVIEMGNHFVWEFIPGKAIINVSPNIGFLHHYRRRCEFGGVECLKAQSTDDKRVWFWGKKLITSFNTIESWFLKNCQSNQTKDVINFNSSNNSNQISSYEIIEKKNLK